MPSVTRAPAFPSAKKRRRDDDDDSGSGGGSSGNVQVPLYGFSKQQQHHHHHVVPTADGVFYASSPQHHNSHPSNLYSTLGGSGERLIFANNRDSGAPATVYNIPRKVIPLPVSKRSRTLPEAHSTQQTRPHDTEARPGLCRSVTASGLLDPCHICHRKPTKKSDLDSFADCMGCGQRTCFVCIRQCQGWLAGGSPTSPGGGRAPPQHHSEHQRQGRDAEDRHQQQDLTTSFTMHDVDDDDNRDEDGDVDSRTSPHRTENDTGPDSGWSGRGHREVICSGCCVERGSEGDVVCLGCLAGMEGA